MPKREGKDACSICQPSFIHQEIPDFLPDPVPDLQATEQKICQVLARAPTGVLHRDQDHLQAIPQAAQAPQATVQHLQAILLALQATIQLPQAIPLRHQATIHMMRHLLSEWMVAQTILKSKNQCLS